MPAITVDLMKGRLESLETKKDFVRQVTDAVVNSLHVRPEQVRIRIIEHERDMNALAGVLRSEDK